MTDPLMPGEIWEEKPKSLITKLSEVMAETERVAKRGRNDFHRYDYATESDIAAAVREHMAKRHLLIVPDVQAVAWREGKGKEGREGGLPIATLTIRFTVYDGDTGETLSFHVLGEGQDSGDKATYKAMTGANKYALLKMFQIPTGDDPEREDGQGGAKTRAERREAARDQARRESAESGPYADRERERVETTNEPPPSFALLMERRTKLPPEIQHAIPTDEAMHAIPPKEATDELPFLTAAIIRKADTLKLAPKERGDLMEQFFGSRRLRLLAQDGAPNPRLNPYFVRALYLHLEA